MTQARPKSWVHETGLHVWRAGRLEAWGLEGKGLGVLECCEAGSVGGLEGWGDARLEAWRAGGLKCWSVGGLDGWWRLPGGRAGEPEGWRAGGA